jgi:DNA-binding MarR family transcriptional regulator
MTELKIRTTGVQHLPPSAKLVYLILQETGPCTQAEVCDRTMLPHRTARNALAKLVEEGLVEARPSLRDARKQLYDVSKKK